jgi:hypothetical protein
LSPKYMVDKVIAIPHINKPFVKFDFNFWLINFICNKKCRQLSSNEIQFDFQYHC